MERQLRKNTPNKKAKLDKSPKNKKGCVCVCGLAGENTCCQPHTLSSISRTHGRREPMPVSCLLTSKWILWHIPQTKIYWKAQGKRGTQPALASLYRAQAWLQQSQIRTRWWLARGITAGPPHSAACLCSGRSGLVLNEDCTSPCLLCDSSYSLPQSELCSISCLPFPPQ